jgi:hypothetical protein
MKNKIYFLSVVFITITVIFACKTKSGETSNTQANDSIFLKEIAVAALENSADKKVVENMFEMYGNIESKLSKATIMYYPTDPIEHHQDGYTFYLGDGGNLVKITHAGGYDGNFQIDYYIKDDKVFFCYHDAVNQTDEGIESFTNRTYFENNKMILWLDTDHRPAKREAAEYDEMYDGVNDSYGYMKTLLPKAKDQLDAAN